MLEAMNNIIQYHWVTSAPLVYFILKKRASFEKLRDLTFPTQAELEVNPIIHLDTAPPEDEDEVQLEEEKEGFTEEGIIHNLQEEGKEYLQSEEEKVELSPSEEEEIRHQPGPIIGLTSGDVLEPQVKCSVLNTRIESSEETENPPELQAEIRDPIPEPWRPTAEWFEMWKSKLPLTVVMTVIEKLYSKLEHLLQNVEGNEATAYDAIISLPVISQLPSPQRFIIRQYQPQLSLTYWLTSYIWGLIYIKNQEISMFDLSEVKIFSVQASAKS